jgi:adenylosuccinate lyase
MNNEYESPLNTRYSSNEMKELFSPVRKIRTWRILWIALAEAEMELGIDIINNEQIEEMKENIDNIDFEYAKEMEKKLRHDVMAHIHTFGAICPKAMPIIHLGATSCYVGDNTDIIIYREALELIKHELLSVIYKLRDFALRYKDLPTLGYTHFQPAQLVTVGKRATLWMNELLMDYEELLFVLKNLKLRGVKGTTGTQESFLNLFGGDHEKVKKLESLVCKKMAFDSAYPVTGQTYSRKVESRILNLLSEIAQSAYKFSNDLRLLQSMKEIEEPFEKDQIGSSAMAYKRNPMRSERISSLARYVIINSLNPAITASTQWFERTLDDSANRRISIPEAFLATDAIMRIYNNVISGLVVYENMIRKHVIQEIPFMSTEKILMEAVKKGGNRQELHEKIRVLSMEAANRVKLDGEENDLISRIAADSSFILSQEEINSIIEPKNFIGRSKEQVEEYIREYIDPVLDKETGYDMTIDLDV